MGEAQRLSILDLSVNERLLSINMLRMQPRQGIIALAEKLQVYWEAVPEATDRYWKVGDGLAYVRKSGQYEAPESFHSDPRSSTELLTWTDFSDGILVFLPKTYTAINLEPPPVATVAKGRIALWWGPTSANVQRTIQLKLVSLMSSAEEAASTINAGAKKVPPSARVFPLAG
jgi:hypothetical protein